MIERFKSGLRDGRRDMFWLPYRVRKAGPMYRLGYLLGTWIA